MAWERCLCEAEEGAMGVSARDEFELLAPAGNWACVRAAAANGADAVYFGLPKFNARMRADNFLESELPELMRFLHARGMRGFCAINTLIFPRELEDAVRQLILLAEAGVDAVIVQDIGLATMVKQVTPSLALHASTQMTLTSPEGLDFVNREVGLDRAVLARELSLRDLQGFSGAVTVPLEVFVHGALCVAYSGQCLTSEALGHRSANRGECAQACRMPYELVVDGEVVDLEERRYLLSPQDLAGAELIPDLIAAGVTSFKIEGRLKSPEYVAAVTRAYRKALDEALVGGEISLLPEDRYALEMVFSRGLSTGWLEGTNHPRLTHGRFGKKRGVLVGTVRQKGRDWFEIDRDLNCSFPVKANEGLVFETGGDTNQEQGGTVFAVEGNRVTMLRDRVDFRLVPVGSRVWKTMDPILQKELKRLAEMESAPIRRPIDLRVQGAIGRLLEVVEVASGIMVKSAMPLLAAEKHPLSAELLRKQFGRLGGTEFELRELEVDLEGEGMIAVSELNRMRRALVHQLGTGLELGEEKVKVRSDWQSLLPKDVESMPQPPGLTVLCRTMDQLDAVLRSCPRVKCVFVDFEDVRRFQDAVEKKRQLAPDVQLYLATPRIQKTRETGYFRLIANAKPDGVLIRNLGAIHFFRKHPELELIGDFSLNVANQLTARFFLDRGMARVTVSYDLNVEQVMDLARGGAVDRLELTLHQHLPMFHMEHCVFCTFLSQGTDYRDCGRPCEKHEVALRDRVGQEHPLKADVGCRNTLFRGQAQSGAAWFESLRQAGLAWFRVELLNEGPAASVDLVTGYQRLLDGDEVGVKLVERMRLGSQLGVVGGTFAGK